MTDTALAPDIVSEAIHAARMARGPSRRLDGLAWAALHGDKIPAGDLSVNAEGVVRVRRHNGKIWRHGTMRERYSESVEMADKALPPDCTWRVTSTNDAVITLHLSRRTPFGTVFTVAEASGIGATPALGLLIAALELKRRIG